MQNRTVRPGDLYIPRFHLHDGVYFRRHDNGDVEFLIRESGRDDARILKHFNATASEWASVVATVSQHGETGESFREALAFHGEGAKGGDGMANTEKDPQDQGEPQNNEEQPPAEKPTEDKPGGETTS